MKNKFLLIGILLVIFIAIIGATFLYFKNKAVNGSLRVVSSPAATVFIQDKEVGKTPYEGTLPEGEYKIKLKPAASGEQVVEWSGTIQMYKNSKTFVNRELGANDLSSSGVIFMLKPMDQKSSTPDTGEVEVQTEPQGAIVYLDGEEKGIAPTVLQNIEKGQHELAVYTPGFFRRSQKIQVEPDHRVVGIIKLAIDPTYKNIEDLKKDQDATGSATLTGTPTPTGTTGSKSVTPTVSATPTVIGSKTTPTPTKKATTTTSGAQVKILDTETGWLRVRSEPSSAGAEVAKVNPGSLFPLLAEQSGWFQIEYEKGKNGWISSKYAEKQ